MTRRGRPPTGSLLTVADVFAATADRLANELPIPCADIAADLSTNRRTLTEVVFRDTGLRWPEFISRISRTRDAADGDDDAMKRITVPLSDATFTRLRRTALSEMRDPRLEARRILERALDQSPEPTSINDRHRVPAA